MTHIFTNNFSKDFNEIFDAVLYGFGKPRNLYFNCKTKDIMPGFWEKTETGYKCTCRTVGISPNDVTVEVEDDCIHIKGETDMDGYKYNTNYELPVSQDVLSNIKNVKYKTENGLTFIYLDIDRPEKKKINIQQI
jgi:HSP20 family molecular chaperone IbpA